MVYLQLIKNEALALNIPIMRDESLDYLVGLINENNYQNVLEIGTATGYSSIYLTSLTKARITSIEKDRDRYLIAESYREKYNINNLSLINDDALTLDLKGQYDLIIIDAAKTKNKELFIKYEPLLIEDGLIITDNIALSVVEGKPLTKNRQKLINKTSEYIEFLKNNANYTTEFLKIGDTIAISRRK